jgi:hypothetical protein
LPATWLRDDFNVRSHHLSRHKKEGQRLRANPFATGLIILWLFLLSTACGE